jgi:hypothetical protein
LAKEGVPNPQKESDEEEFSSSVEDDEEDMYINGNKNQMIDFDPNQT